MLGVPLNITIYSALQCLGCVSGGTGERPRGFHCPKEYYDGGGCKLHYFSVTSTFCLQSCFCLFCFCSFGK